MGIHRWDGYRIDTYALVLRPKADDDTTPERRVFPPTVKEEYDPSPDHVVALMHHSEPISAWAHERYDPRTATHVNEFLRTRNPQFLVTLTDKEHQDLCDFAKSRGIKTKALNSRAGR